MVVFTPQPNRLMDYKSCLSKRKHHPNWFYSFLLISLRPALVITDNLIVKLVQYDVAWGHLLFLVNINRVYKPLIAPLRHFSSSNCNFCYYVELAPSSWLCGIIATRSGFTLSKRFEWAIRTVTRTSGLQ